MAIIGGSVWGYFELRDDDGATPQADTSTDAEPQVVVIDESEVEVVQNPSLRLFEEDGTWYVENDGNVTMSEIEVADGSGAVICELGTLSPDDRAACDEAGGDGLVATGSGPQGQPVEVGPAG